MVAPVTDPGFAEHLFAKSSWPFLLVPAEVLVWPRVFIWILKRVSRSPDCHERLACQVVVGKMLHVRIWPLPKTEHRHTKVCVVENRQARHIRLIGRIDLS